MLIQNDYLTESSKSFCMMPWVHSYVHTDGQVSLCCVAKTNVGKLDATTSLKAIWNSPEYKKTRLEMLAGTPVQGCSGCDNNERIHRGSSLRAGYNIAYGKYFEEIVQQTYPDGSLPTMNFKHLDIRWNNICNLKCRSCNSGFSSLIAAEQLKYTGFSALPGNAVVVSVQDRRPNFLNEIIPQLHNVETIYFAGGEPLVTKEHYQILTYLIEHGLTSVKLEYNTNFSKLIYSTWDVIELWKHFPVINVRPSLDSWNERAEYLRTNTNWQQVESNINRMQTECPHIKFTVSTVISAFNILTLHEFLEYMISKFNLWDSTSRLVDIKWLNGPRAMSINQLPNKLKQQAITNIQLFRDNYPNNIDLINELNIVISKLQNSLDVPADINSKEFIDQLDIRRDTKFVAVFPELEDWYNSL